MMELGDKLCVQNKRPGHPEMLLRTVPLLVDYVLKTQTSASDIQTPHCVSRLIIDEPGGRQGFERRGQKAGGHGLQLGHMEGWVNFNRFWQGQMDG